MTHKLKIAVAILVGCGLGATGMLTFGDGEPYRPLIAELFGPQHTVIAAPLLDEFRVVREETWGAFSKWHLYVLQHKPTGACFVAVDPPGEGGGAITSTDPRVCAR